MGDPIIREQTSAACGGFVKDPLDKHPTIRGIRRDDPDPNLRLSAFAFFILRRLPIASMVEPLAVERCVVRDLGADCRDPHATSHVQKFKRVLFRVILVMQSRKEEHVGNLRGIKRRVIGSPIADRGFHVVDQAVVVEVVHREFLQRLARLEPTKLQRIGIQSPDHVHIEHRLMLLDVHDRVLNIEPRTIESRFLRSKQQE